MNRRSFSDPVPPFIQFFRKILEPNFLVLFGAVEILPRPIARQLNHSWDNFVAIFRFGTVNHGIQRIRPVRKNRALITMADLRSLLQKEILQILSCLWSKLSVYGGTFDPVKTPPSLIWVFHLAWSAPHKIKKEWNFCKASARTISSIVSSFLWPAEDTSVRPCGLLPFRTTPDGTQRNILDNTQITSHFSNL